MCTEYVQSSENTKRNKGDNSQKSRNCTSMSSHQEKEPLCLEVIYERTGPSSSFSTDQEPANLPFDIFTTLPNAFKVDRKKTYQAGQCAELHIV